MASEGSAWIRYISKCTEQGRTLQDKVPLEEIRPQILRIIKIRRFKGELKGFDDRRAVITAKPLVYPLSQVVLPAMSSQEALLAGHFHLHHKKALMLILIKYFSQRIKFFLNLISWKLPGTQRMVF